MLFFFFPNCGRCWQIRGTIFLTLKSIWQTTVWTVCLFLEIIILLIIAKYFKTMYYVLNTGRELSGAQKGRNIQIVSWSLLSKTLLLLDSKQLERWKDGRVHSTISNYCSSKQHCSPLKPVRVFLLCPFSRDGTQGMAEGMKTSGAAAHLGGHLPSRLAPCFSQLLLCDGAAENQASSAWCWGGFGNFAVWGKNVVMSNV